MLAIAVLNIYHCSKQTNKQTSQQTISDNKNWVKLVNKLNKVKISRKLKEKKILKKKSRADQGYDGGGGE